MKRIIVVLSVVNLLGCTAYGMPYYGEYTRGGAAADYVSDRNECRDAANKRAVDETFGGGYFHSGDAKMALANKYTKERMDLRGYEWVKKY